jgi:serine/threonine-protein kinase
VLITHPAYGSNVEACGVLSGTADLPSGETLVLSVQNLSDRTKTLYLQPVNDWDKPSAISAWTGYQYFGSGDSSVGQMFEVSVVVMKTAMVKQALSQSVNNPTWAVPALPTGASVKASIRLVRKQGSGPTVCQ